MDSVVLVHPEETLTVPFLQATTKCSLFQHNAPLAGAPYRVQSAVTLSLFRDFVSAVGGKEDKITATNFRRLQRLCEEFDFSGFAAKLSKFSDPSKDSEGCQLGSPLAGVRSAHLSESFQFIPNGNTVESSVAEAAALFRAAFGGWVRAKVCFETQRNRNSRHSFSSTLSFR
jgi:hypothetical protein